MAHKFGFMICHGDVPCLHCQIVAIEIKKAMTAWETSEDVAMKRACTMFFARIPLSVSEYHIPR